MPVTAVATFPRVLRLLEDAMRPRLCSTEGCLNVALMTGSRCRACEVEQEGGGR